MNLTLLDGYTLNPGDLSWSPLEALGNFTVYDRTEAADVLARSRDADIILTNKTRLPADVINALPRLACIGLLSTGYDVVDVQAAARRGIPVCNVPGYSTCSVAQMAFAHLLNITNRTGAYAVENAAGKWCRQTDFCYRNGTLTELDGKVFATIGLGRIGKETARIAQAFGMRVWAYTSQKELPAGVEKKTLDAIFAGADVVALNCPLTPETKQLVNAERLAAMKPAAILINTARGGLVDEQALASALNSGQLAAYGSDVLSAEPPAEDNPLLTARNAFFTPHIAWATAEARTRLLQAVADNVVAFCSGTPQNIVNNPLQRNGISLI